MERVIMDKHDNSMILNGKNIGISYIELNEEDLLIYDKSSKYCFSVYLMNDWDKIRSIKPK